jgi:hypothetical protein
MIRRRVAGLLTVLALLAGAMVVGVPGTPLKVVPAGAAYPLGEGYYLAARDGGMFTFGDAQFYGSTGNIKLNQPIVGMEATPFLEGYWLVATDGGIFTFGSAGFYGSTGSLKLNRPIVGMGAAPNGLGYWLVASDGGIFTFGSTAFYGSTGDIALNQPIVGMAPTPSGKGYWLVATDGGIFTFGDAEFFGSTGSLKLNRPIVGMEPTPSGKGYWLVASDGGIFTFGDAPFLGSMGSVRLNAPIVGMERSRSGSGYQMVATDGGIFNFGNSNFFGSTGSMRLNQPVLGMAIRPALGVTADAYATDVNDMSQSSSWTAGANPTLSMTKTAPLGAPAGARILGVEGLDLAQLNTIAFDVVGGPCTTSGPAFVLTYDTNGDGAGDATSRFACATGTSLGGPLSKAWSPTALGLPGAATVTSLDLTYPGPPATSTVDNILVAGLTITDSNVVRAA